MTRLKRYMVFGILGALAAVLSGCASSGLTSDELSLRDARQAAADALEDLLEGWPGSVEDVGIRNGVPVVQSHAPEGTEGAYEGAYGYGAWLGERGFAVYTYTVPVLGTIVDTHKWPEDETPSDGAPGDEAGFTATWQGVMLGMDSGAEGDAGVAGDARMDLDSGAHTVDIEFTNVEGINNDNEYDDHSWEDISVTGNSFNDHVDETTGMCSGGADDCISGQFYGDHHEDVMGNFMYDTITGAWGASRGTTGTGGDMDGGDMDGGDEWMGR